MLCVCGSQNGTFQSKPSCPRIRHHHGGKSPHCSYPYSHSGLPVYASLRSALIVRHRRTRSSCSYGLASLMSTRIVLQAVHPPVHCDRAFRVNPHAHASGTTMKESPTEPNVRRKEGALSAHCPPEHPLFSFCLCFYRNPVDGILEIGHAQSAV